MKYVAETQECSYEVEVEQAGELRIEGVPRKVDLRAIDRDALYSIIVDGQSYEAFVEWSEGTCYVFLEGERHAIRIEDERTRMLARLGGKAQPVHGEVSIKAPMPGMVVKLVAEPGAEVKIGDPLLILEAMKMENEIRAPRQGVVKVMRVGAGQKVNKDDLLVIIE